MIGKKMRKIMLLMFCMLKKEKTYPTYVSKHNSDREKQVILLMILNGEKRKAKVEGNGIILQ